MNYIGESPNRAGRPAQPIMTPDSSESTENSHREWLIERRKHFDELVGSVEDYAIFMMTKEGIILDWNSGAELLKGYRSEEIVGKSFATFYSEKERRAKVPEEELKVAAARGRFATEGWRLRKGGSRFWAGITISAIKTAGGEVAGFLEITRDLTERRESHEALRQSEERFRLLIESVSEYAIFMLDPDGTIVSWNTGACRIKGYEADEIIGQHFSRFYTTEANVAGLPLKLLKQALERGSAEDEGWRIRKSGQAFWASVLITAVWDEHGDHRGFVKITRDLTERKMSQQLARASERKDTFLATLAHELRNPLAPMGPGIEVILKAPHETGRVVQVASMIRRQVDQMAHLIEDLVDLSRITTGKIALRSENVLLTEVIESALEACDPLIVAKSHRLNVRIPQHPMTIHVDKHRLSQALTNLLANAAKYTPANGHIELTARFANGNLLELAVRDDGVGIAPDRLESIFNLFDQGEAGSPDGLGIGLALVRTIVELHGGQVVARSEGEGRGSEFVVHLPVVAAGQDRPHEHDLEAADPTPRYRALIADDSVSSADTLALLFETEGFASAVANDGEQAVKLAGLWKPDVVCLDIGMPTMDGHEAAGQIRKLLPRAFLVAVTGRSSEEDRRRSKAAGFDLHLIKPLKADELFALVRANLARCPS